MKYIIFLFSVLLFSQEKNIHLVATYQNSNTSFYAGSRDSIPRLVEVKLATPVLTESENMIAINSRGCEEIISKKERYIGYYNFVYRLYETRNYTSFYDTEASEVKVINSFVTIRKKFLWKRFLYLYTIFLGVVAYGAFISSCEFKKE